MGLTLDGAERLAAEARRAAAAAGFERSSAAAVGRLLRALASSRPGGRIAEAGTGFGVGTTWLMSGLGPRGRLVTVELDEERAAAARRRFLPYPSVRVVSGDWRAALPPLAPFDLVFLDGGSKQDAVATFAAARPLLRAGGLLLVDDLTPGRPGPDPVRAVLLGGGDWLGVELTLTPREAAILAVPARP